MKIKSIRWQLSLSYAGIAFLAALILGGTMIFILSWNFRNLERNYLIESAKEIGEKAFFFLENDDSEEYIIEIMTRLSFYIDAQIRFLDAGETVLADSGLPQSYTKILIDKEEFEEGLKEREEIFISRGKGSFFSSWLIRNQEDIQTSGVVDDIRSDQVVTEAFYDKNKQIVGYVELSNGPTYGRDILWQVAGGWAIAALLAVILAGFAGMWVSRRFSNPIESLTHTTTRMAAGDLSIRSDIDRKDEFGTLSRSFDQMADNIEANDKTLRRFIADAAHELGTPLTALRTNLELIDDEHIPFALEQVGRVDSLTQSLLELSQLEATDSEIEFIDLNLSSLLEDVSEAYASRAEQAGLGFFLDISNDPIIIRGDSLGFFLDISNDPIIIRGDSEKLRTLIRNLLDNAIKFTPAGGHVQINLSELDDGVQLIIEDSGIGIPDEDIPHLFSRFHRASNAAGYPGNGLGLAIVKTIADQHNATINVKHMLVGTEFKIQFPQK
jgi:signal transduction histidine kinase